MGDDNFGRIWEAIFKLAKYDNLSKTNELPGCWERTIDDRWWLALNGHGEATESSRGTTVSPYSCYIECDGWPAAVIDWHSVEFCAGETANADTFCAAIDAACEGERT